MAEPEYYVAPMDGQQCLRIPGRFRRHRLPLAALPPAADPAGEGCFLCHPEDDEWFHGRHQGLAVVGNAFGIGERSWLLAPPGPGAHECTLAQLPGDQLSALWSLASEGPLRAELGLSGREEARFANVGVLAAQSRRHPHVQVVGFDPRRRHGSRPDAAAIEADLAAAAAEGRRLRIAGTEREVVIPRHPSLSLELWLPAASDGEPFGALGAAARACEQHISGCYNVVAVAAPRLLRLIPRGISERAGLELSCPHLVGSVVTASVAESVELWSRALEGAAS